MSDLMLHGVLNMPLPNDPAECDIVTWVAFRSAARQAADRITELDGDLIFRTAERNHAHDVIDTYVEQVKELEAKLARAEWLLNDALVQLREGKIRTRRNRADLIDKFLDELKGNTDD